MGVNGEALQLHVVYKRPYFLLQVTRESISVLQVTCVFLNVQWNRRYVHMIKSLITIPPSYIEKNITRLLLLALLLALVTIQTATNSWYSLVLWWSYIVTWIHISFYVYVSAYTADWHVIMPLLCLLVGLYQLKFLNPLHFGETLAPRSSPSFQSLAGWKSQRKPDVFPPVNMTWSSLAPRPSARPSVQFTEAQQATSKA